MLESIINKSDERLIPFSAMLELTSRCNLACRHCYLSGAQETETPLERILELINELKQAGCLFLTITGGEPLMHHGLLEVLERADSSGLVVSLFTNGTLLTPNIADRLSQFNIMDVSLSIYGASGETHDRMTGLAGSFGRTINAAKILKGKGLSVIFKVLVTRDNFPEYKQMLAMAKRLDIPYNLDPLVTPCDDGNPRPLEFRLDDDNLKRIYRNQIPYHTSPISNQGFACSFGRSHCAISAAGDIYACIQLARSAGNINQQRFMDIWQHSEWLKEVRNFSAGEVAACRKCSVSSSCRQCPGLSYLETGNFYTPSPETCRHARLVTSY
ncbi:MAG: radical SAM protein [Planctomycetes bacterium]|nr:radical SAM protein [Planctomycetota bacterium]